MLVNNDITLELNAVSTNQAGETVAIMNADYNDGGLFIIVKLFQNDEVLNQDLVDFKDLVFEQKEEIIDAYEAMHN